MFTYTHEMIKANHYAVDVITNDLYASVSNNPILNIKTFYEQQWLDRGISIKYIRFVLEKKSSFKEPDIEIEKDSYRSFGRNQHNNQSKQNIK